MQLKDSPGLPVQWRQSRRPSEHAATAPRPKKRPAAPAAWSERSRALNQPAVQAEQCLEAQLAASLSVYPAGRSSRSPGSDRQQRCRSIGERLQQARCAHGLSVYQLASLTYIQPYQITAVEAGHLIDPDDDVYLRGFLNRLGLALGLEVTGLLAELPPVGFSPVPSWYRQELYRNPCSLWHYCGYAALTMGAIGGLSWGMQQVQGATPYTVQTGLVSTQRAVEAELLPSPAAMIAPPEQLHGC